MKISIAAASRSRWPLVVLLLLAAYQLPGALRQMGLGEAIAALAMLAFLPFAWGVARTCSKGMGEAYALEWNAHARRVLLWGVVVALLAKAAGIGAGLGLGIYEHSSTGSRASATDWIQLISWLAISTFVPSIAEDIVTRGVWARWSQWEWRGVGFVAATSVVYLFNHVYRLGNGGTEWAMLLCFGLAYGTACWCAGTLWAAVGLHWGWNLAGSLFDSAVSIEVVDIEAARLLSAITHLMLLAVMVLVFNRRSSGATRFGGLEEEKGLSIKL